MRFAALTNVSMPASCPVTELSGPMTLPKICSPRIPTSDPLIVFPLTVNPLVSIRAMPAVQAPPPSKSSPSTDDGATSSNRSMPPLPKTGIGPHPTTGFDDPMPTTEIPDLTWSPPA